MPGRVWAAIGWVVVAVAGGWAADPVGVRPADLPPLDLPGRDGAVIPNGQLVSQPLSPVAGPADLAPAPLPQTVCSPPVEAGQPQLARPLGHSWDAVEYLLWWPKAQPVPPLAAAGRGAQSLLLAGGSSLGNPDVSGARFTTSLAVNDQGTAGLAVTYLVLGTRTVTATVADTGLSRARTLGRPIGNPLTGEPDVIPVAVPGHLRGAVTAATTVRVTGWEVTGVASLYADPEVRLTALAGYRYFMANEGLRVEQTGLFLPGPGRPAVLAGAADQFDAHNRFHGGQVGLAAEWDRGPVFVEATGKVALGRAVTVVRVGGLSVAVAPGDPVPNAAVFAGGVLAQPTNTGRWARSGFAVLPEATLKVGCRVRDRSRVYVGYNFIYLSEAVRPGDQVDLAVDPSQVPAFGRPGVAIADRPAPVLAKSDFWVQGLVFGFEYRY